MTFRRKLPAAALCLAAFLTAPPAAMGQAAAPPATSPAAPPPSGTEIVVTGSREEIRTELKGLLATTSGQIARYDAPLCPRIIGFDPEYSAHLRDLILANAEAIGLPRGKPDCTTNAVIIFNDRPQELVAVLRERMHWLFGELSLPARDRITKPKRTSYAWRANYLGAADGRAVENAAGVLGGQLGEFFADVPTVRSFGTGSRIVLPVVQTTATAFLVLDITRTPGMSLQQIADFATLNLLLDLDHDAQDHARTDSILGLFDAADPSTAPARMSAFDRALAKAVYTPQSLAASDNRVRAQLVSIIKREEDEDAEKRN